MVNIEADALSSQTGEGIANFLQHLHGLCLFNRQVMTVRDDVESCFSMRRNGSIAAKSVDVADGIELESTTKCFEFLKFGSRGSQGPC